MNANFNQSFSQLDAADGCLMSQLQCKRDPNEHFVYGEIQVKDKDDENLL